MIRHTMLAGIFLLVTTLMLSATEAHYKSSSDFSAIAELGLVAARGKMGIPDGVNQAGFSVYFDFDTQQMWRVPFAAAAPEGWDFAITYLLKNVKMGPVGTFSVPFLAARVNDQQGGGYYPVYSQYEQVRDFDSDKLVTPEWKGLGHRKFKDNKVLNRKQYRPSFPYLSYDWYELTNMNKFRYQPYRGRTFVIRTTQGQAVKVGFTDIEGYYDGKKLFRVKFRYSLIMEADESPEVRE